MKRIVIALAVAAVLAGGVVTARNVFDNSSVATAGGADHMVSRTEVEKPAKENYGIPFVQERLGINSAGWRRGYGSARGLRRGAGHPPPAGRRRGPDRRPDPWSAVRPTSRT